MNQIKSPLATDYSDVEKKESSLRRLYGLCSRVGDESQKQRLCLEDFGQCQGEIDVTRGW